MKSVFFRIVTIGVELLAGVAVTVLLAILAVPDVLGAMSFASRKVLTILALLAGLSGFSAFVGCSAKQSPAPEQPRVVHWRGQESGYEDATTVQPTDKQ